MQTTLVVILANQNHFISRWLDRPPTQVEIAAAFYGASTTPFYDTVIVREAVAAILITGTKIQEYSASQIRWCVKNLLEPGNEKPEPTPDNGCDQLSC